MNHSFRFPVSHPLNPLPCSVCFGGGRTRKRHGRGAVPWHGRGPMARSHGMARSMARKRRGPIRGWASQGLFGEEKGSSLCREVQMYARREMHGEQEKFPERLQILPYTALQLRTKSKYSRGHKEEHLAREQLLGDTARNVHPFTEAALWGWSCQTSQAPSSVF